jgi:hypothetical protein
MDTYNLLSGPKVIAVGKFKPDAIVVLVPSRFIRIISPVPGVGKGLPVVFSSTYIPPTSSNVTPRTAENPLAATDI